MDAIIPMVGATGYFELGAPFDTLQITGERYTCQAVRKISDYIANNENVKVDIYDKNTIAESIYDTHVEQDVYILSLQAAIGHWIYVPAPYVLKYPVTNGVPYRSVSIVLALPALPASRNIDFLLTDLQNLVKDALGVDSNTKIVETSRVTLVPKVTHDATQSARLALASGRVTDRSRAISTQTQLTQALLKITELETFIKNNHT